MIIKEALIRGVKKYSKGAITIILLISMCPFLSVAAILIEVNRYNNAVTALDELLGVNSVATLGNYDDYLHDRFGLLAVSQKRDPGVVYNSYLEYNKKVLGKTIDIKNSNFSGSLPLSEREYLMRQIMEYAYLDVPVTMAKGALPIDELSDMLKKKLNILNNIMGLFKSSSSMLNDTKTLYENAGKLKESSRTIEEFKTVYETKYTELNNAAIALAEAYDNDGDSEESSDDIDANKQSFTNIKVEYNEINDSIIYAMNEYKKLLEANAEAIADITNNIGTFAGDIISLRKHIEDNKSVLNDIDKELKQMEDDYGVAIENDSGYIAGKDYREALSAQIAEDQTNLSILEAGSDALNTAMDGMNDNFKGYTADSLQKYINKFNSQYENVSHLKIDDNNYPDYLSGLDDTIYHFAKIEGYIPESAIDAYLESQKEAFVESSFSAVIDMFVSFYKSIFKTSVFYDPELSANIDEAFYNSTFGGLPGGEYADSPIMEVIRQIGVVVKNGEKIARDVWNVNDTWWENLKSSLNPFEKLISIINSIIELINSIVTLFEKILDVARDITINLVSFFTDGYERLCLSAYSTYNMPCRTDNSGGSLSFKAMTGKSFSGNSFLAQQSTMLGIPIIDGLVALVDSIDAMNSGGDDITFSGAELEYVMVGSKSEIANQAIVFLQMYFLRLLIDLPFIFTNAEVETIAGASTFGYPVVIALYIFLEPLADMLLLVNDADVPLIKTSIYLTPSGLPGLISGFTSVKFSDAQKDELKSNMLSAYKVTEDDYNYGQYQASMGGSSSTKILSELFNMNYRTHCMILMLLIPTNAQQLARIQNIIQMEGVYHYKDILGLDSNGFNLNKTYACVTGEVSADINHFLPLPSLSSDSLFSITRTQTRGY